MSNLIKSVARFSLGTFLSRVSGMLRDVVLAGVFGSSALMEAFLLASRVPNLFRDIVAEGALGSAFTKTYTQRMETDPQAAKNLFYDFLILYHYVFHQI